jgi:hypothetical protein
MKNLTNGLMCLFLSCCFITTSGQPPINEPDFKKPALFKDVPEKVNVKVHDLENLFDLALGQTINIPLHGQATLNGHIISKSDVTDLRVQSVVIKLTNRKGANFTFTRIANGDGYDYIGRIMSREHIDVLELVLEDGQYIFRKTGLYELLAE